MRYKIPAVKIIEWSYNFRITVEFLCKSGAMQF
jgi:hypothetical protein